MPYGLLPSERQALKGQALEATEGFPAGAVNTDPWGASFCWVFRKYRDLWGLSEKSKTTVFPMVCFVYEAFYFADSRKMLEKFWNLQNDNQPFWMRMSQNMICPPKFTFGKEDKEGERFPWVSLSSTLQDHSKKCLRKKQKNIQIKLINSKENITKEDILHGSWNNFSTFPSKTGEVQLEGVHTALSVTAAISTCQASRGVCVC